MPPATKTLAQAAAAAGVTRKAIRVYEERGLLEPAERTTAGYRLFTDTDVDTLAFIRRARTLGLRLDDIADILAIRRGGTAPCDTVNDLIDTRAAEIDQAIADLQHLRAALTDIRSGHRPACTSASVICTIIESSQEVCVGPMGGRHDVKSISAARSDPPALCDGRHRTLTGCGSTFALT